MIYIISALATAGLTACDTPVAILNTVKTATKQCMPVTVPLGVCLFAAGECAACCPDPLADPYSHADLASIITRNLDVAVDPYIDFCAQWAPPAGLALLTPLVCYGLSESTLRAIACLNSCRGNNLHKND